TPGPLRPLVFLDEPGSKMDLRISPDETLAAYLTRSGKEMGVFVAPFPGGGARWEATDNGASPMWNPSGKELFFTSRGSVMSVEVSTKPSVTLVRRKSFSTWTKPPSKRRRFPGDRF